MNRYLRALVVVPTGALKMGFAKLFSSQVLSRPCPLHDLPHSEITLDGGKLTIGSGFKMRDGAKPVCAKAPSASSAKMSPSTPMI